MRPVRGRPAVATTLAPLEATQAESATSKAAAGAEQPSFHGACVGDSVTRRRKRAILVRDQDGLIEALDRRVEQERQSAPGRRVTREGVVRELLFTWLRYLTRP